MLNQVKLTCKEVGTIAIFLVSIGTAVAQEADSIQHRLEVDLEIRPRAEFRTKYRLSASDSYSPDFYISQRNRIALEFHSKPIDLVASLQEIHLWNKSGNVSKVGNINFFELYMNYKLGRFTLRAGRQGLLLDNGRIFSDAPWAQQSRSHEGLGLTYANESIETEAYWMFTRSYSDRFDPAYSPVASHNYKHLFVYHVKGKVREYWNYMGIFSSEIFEKGAMADWRITAGGRVEYQNDGNYLTFNGYYQKIKSRKPLNLGSGIFFSEVGWFFLELISHRDTKRDRITQHGSIQACAS